MVLVFWYFKTVNWRNKSCISEELKKVWFPFFTGVKHSEKHHTTHLTQNTWRPISCMHSDILSSLPAYFNKTSTGQDKIRTDAKRLPKRPTASLDMPGNAQCMGAGGQKMFFFCSRKLVQWVGRSGGAGCKSILRTPNFTWFGTRIGKKGHFWSKRTFFGIGGHEGRVSVFRSHFQISKSTGPIL